MYSTKIDSPIRYLKGVGEARERALLRMGIKTVEDLLFFFPRRYEDRRNMTLLSSLTPNTYAAVIAKVISIETYPTHRKGLNVTSVLLSDGSSTVRAVWFNRPHLKKVITAGLNIALYGKVEKRDGLQISNPEFEVLDGEDPCSVGKIVPIYPATSDLSAKWVRRIIDTALDAYLSDILDFLPADIKRKYGFADLSQCVLTLHHPQNKEDWIKARNRLAFDELFLLQSGLYLRKKKRTDFKKTVQLKPGSRSTLFLKSLPFQLTAAQRRVIDEISNDMGSDVPMHRLLQGDVGTGKTAVAASALMIAVDSGVQAAFMAPTEILAQQHFLKLKQMFSELDVEILLLTGSLSVSRRRESLKKIVEGTANIVVGTHALLGEKVEFKNLELIIIDEQHRFGVLQKTALAGKSEVPHVLVMTATPIPRTLTLSIYGDLDVSIIDEMPLGRVPIKTVALTPNRIQQLLRFLKGNIAQGHQAYWVCPLVEESEHLDLTAAYTRFDYLKQVLPQLRIGLLHGRMSGAEKEKIMNAFTKGAIDLLVSTSVIEVGVDVPNATAIIIEEATRFGLAQLHQLRGRVGRGSKESYCILLSDPSTPEARARIEAMLLTGDGFKIAEMDLRQRGPGEVCGVKQHGITDFRVADLVRDRKLLEIARSEAQSLLGRDADLLSQPFLRSVLLRRLADILEIAATA